MTITTTEKCPECGHWGATCEHGLLEYKTDAPLHYWNCPECGERYALVCYDCGDCNKAYEIAENT